MTTTSTVNRAARREDVLAAVGQQIRTRRRLAGLSQAGLAFMIGADGKTVNRVENGHHALDIVGLVAVASALGTAPEALLHPGAADGAWEPATALVADGA